MDDQVIPELTAIFFGTIAGFFALMYVSKFMLEGYFNMFAPDSEYHKMNMKTKMEYHSRNVSDIHVLIALPLALYSLFAICEGPTYSSIFNDDVCLRKPHRY